MSYSSNNIHELNEKEYNSIFDMKCIKTGNKCFILSTLCGYNNGYTYHVFVDSYLRYNNDGSHIIKHDITNTYIFVYLKKLNNGGQESDMRKYFDLSNPIHKIDSFPIENQITFKNKIKEQETNIHSFIIENQIYKELIQKQDEQIKKLEDEKQMLLQSIEVYKSVILLIHNKK